MQREVDPLDPLTISAELADRARPRLVLGGDLDFRTGPSLSVHLEKLLDTDPEHLVLDVVGLRFLDSTGLSIIVQTWRACQEAGVLLVLRDVPPFLESILRITGVADLLARQPVPPAGPETTNRVRAG